MIKTHIFITIFYRIILWIIEKIITFENPFDSIWATLQLLKWLQVQSKGSKKFLRTLCILSWVSSVLPIFEKGCLYHINEKKFQTFLVIHVYYKIPQRTVIFPVFIVQYLIMKFINGMHKNSCSGLRKCQFVYFLLKIIYFITYR